MFKSSGLLENPSSHGFRASFGGAVFVRLYLRCFQESGEVYSLAASLSVMLG